jgi:polar amino acid transport system substrate-binding protein
MDTSIIAALAPHGELRAAINMSNFLLVTGKTATGDPDGVSPDMARAVAKALDVPLRLIPYDSPGLVADAAVLDEWDIGNIGAEPQRAETITFTAAYCEIESTYLVPPGSSIRSIGDVDKPGVRIAVAGRSAYGLWLEANIQHAELVRTDSLDDSYDAFVEQKLDVLAGLRPRLITDAARIDGARILDGKFSSVQQAIGTPKTRPAAASQWLAQFVENTKSSGLVGELIDKHQVKGLSVAPPSSA